MPKAPRSRGTKMTLSAFLSYCSSEDLAKIAVNGLQLENVDHLFLADSFFDPESEKKKT